MVSVFFFITVIINPIAFFHSPFTSKFGIPKQSGLVHELEGEVIFTPQYCNTDYIRGIEGFHYLWLIWEFSANPHKATSPVVRPPVLGGNEKVGVFATRSPFRPNNLGLSSVRLTDIINDPKRGLILKVRGADLMDGTPIYDIKPYIAYADSHPDAKSGFVDINPIHFLNVEVKEELRATLQGVFSAEQLEALRGALSLDPRPHYHKENTKTYTMPFMKYDISFRVVNDTCIIEALTEIG